MDRADVVPHRLFASGAKHDGVESGQDSGSSTASQPTSQHFYRGACVTGFLGGHPPQVLVAPKTAWVHDRIGGHLSEHRAQAL